MASSTKPLASGRARRGPLAIVLRLLAYLAGAGLIALAVVQSWFFAHVLWWNLVNPGSSAFMDVSLDRLRQRSPQAKIDYRWVPYALISDHLKRAVVSAEDAKFLDHEGFDWQAIQKALTRNQKRGRIVAGASTISQQLAKNLFLSGERSWMRKGQEAAITWMLETVMSKRRILELYLNLAEWGEGIFGAEAAARRHFDVGAERLGPSQAAWLASVLPSPRRHVRGHTTPYLEGRVATIRSRMAGAAIP